MFYTLILENETGQKIDLSKTANRYMFSKIKGLDPPTGTVSTSNYAGMNGSYLNNAFIEKRNVVIPFEMRGFDVELRRHELYRVVKPSRYIKIYYSTKNISVYADDGISGTNTKKRSEFNRMIEDCEAGNIDMIITKSISRFARNTLDCLKYIRQLKEKNIPVFFEKESINTMDAKGEVLITIVICSNEPLKKSL